MSATKSQAQNRKTRTRTQCNAHNNASTNTVDSFKSNDWEGVEEERGAPGDEYLTVDRNAEKVLHYFLFYLFFI